LNAPSATLGHSDFAPHTENRFRDDNTEGYSTANLAELNRRYEAAIAEAGIDTDDPDNKSICDGIAEKVLSQFDS
jgi:hypothetical protein